MFIFDVQEYFKSKPSIDIPIRSSDNSSLKYNMVEHFCVRTQ